jgi:hypothetical protein
LWVARPKADVFMTVKAKIKHFLTWGLMQDFDG